MRRPTIALTLIKHLPSGTEGAFAATVIGGMTQTGKARIYARCKTFVPSTWLKPDQQFLPRAVDVQNTAALDLWHWGERIGEVLPVLA
jgi:hypothetical protein